MLLFDFPQPLGLAQLTGELFFPVSLAFAEDFLGANLDLGLALLDLGLGLLQGCRLFIAQPILGFADPLVGLCGDALFDACDFALRRFLRAGFDRCEGGGLFGLPFGTGLRQALLGELLEPRTLGLPLAFGLLDGLSGPGFLARAHLGQFSLGFVAPLLFGRGDRLFGLGFPVRARVFEFFGKAVLPMRFTLAQDVFVLLAQRRLGIRHRLLLGVLPTLLSRGQSLGLLGGPLGARGSEAALDLDLDGFGGGFGVGGVAARRGFSGGLGKRSGANLFDQTLAVALPGRFGGGQLLLGGAVPALLGLFQALVVLRLHFAARRVDQCCGLLLPGFLGVAQAFLPCGAFRLSRCFELCGEVLFPLGAGVFELGGKALLVVVAQGVEQVLTLGLPSGLALGELGRRALLVLGAGLVQLALALLEPSRSCAFQRSLGLPRGLGFRLGERSRELSLQGLRQSGLILLGAGLCFLARGGHGFGDAFLAFLAPALLGVG